MDDLINSASDNLKVLLQGYACSPHRGGESGATWAWAWNLSNLHQVWVLAHPHAQADIRSYLLDHPNPNLHIVFVTPPAIVTRHRPILGGSWLRLRFTLWQHAALKEARRLHSLHHFDICQHVSWGTVSAAPLLWKLGIPFVWGPIGGGQKAPPAFRGYYGKRWFRESARNYRLSIVPLLPGIRRAVRKSSALLSTNHETEDLLERAGAEKVELFLDSGIREGILPPSPPQRRSGRRISILWAGRLDAGKGLPLALEALALANDVPARLIVAGDGLMRAKWQDCASRCGVQSRVEFLGHVKWNQMLDVYRSAEIFLFTSLRDSFGGVLLEAMAQALPIIALDHQGVRAFVPSGASIKVPVRNPRETVSAIASAIRELWLSPARRLQMGAAAWEFARTQTWPLRAERMTAIYRHLLGAVSASDVGLLPSALPAVRRGIPNSNRRIENR
jgi:glycosyltransferase involved in cell wall biosynthesis